MEKVKKRTGISLIVLVITILVMIILAGVVIVNMSENNPIGKAKEARFKEDLTAIGEELELFVAHKLAENSSFKKESLNASTKKLEYNTKTDAKENMYTVFPSLKGTKYANQIEVIAGNLYYKSPDKKEIAWLKDMGVYYTGKVTGTVIIEGDTLVGVSEDYVNTGTLVIPSTVKKISRGAFAGCEDINAIVFQEPTDPNEPGITEIPMDCFKNCKGLTKVQLPSTVKVIQSYAFYACNSLVEVNMPRDLEQVKTSAFFSCISLPSVSFTNVKKIDNGAFRFCAKLAKVDFGNSLQHIEYIAFGNTAIKEVVFPNTLVKLEGSIFYDTDTLTTVKIGETVPGVVSPIQNIVLENAVFRNCDGITNITIAENNNHKYVNNVRYNKAGTEMQEVPASQGNFTIPEGVTTIKAGAFLNNSQITEIAVPNGVTTIEENAFSSMKELTTLSIPSTVTEIGRAIIGTTKKLTKCTIDNNPNYYMDNGAIVHKYTDPVTNVAEKKIIGCIGGLKGKYTVTEGITLIGEFAFQECSGINEIQIASTVRKIEKYGLYLLNGMESLTIPGNVKTLEHAAIHYCTGLRTVTLEEGVENIANEMFKYCINLHTVNLPSTLKEVGVGIFKETPKLTKVTVPDVATSKFAAKGNMLFTKDLTELVSVGCDMETKIITVPAHVRKIRDQAIAGNKHATEVRISQGVTTLGNNILIDSEKVKRLTIPSTVTYIGVHALQRTDALSEIIIDKPKDSIQGAPWYATQGLKAITWR